MKIRTTKVESDLLHLFLYGYPGCGKTKAAGDFHKAGESIALVTCERGELTLDVMGINAPILEPETEDELRAIIECPEMVVERVIRGKMGFTDYVVKTWVFDNLRSIQQMIFGESKRDQRDVFGDITVPAYPATGIMALPNARDAQGVPSNKDYRILDDRMRRVIKRIEQMPYHTIVTAHAEEDFSVKTKMSMTGDIKKDQDVTRVLTGYPSLDGFALKADLPGLVSDFFMYLESNGQQYLCYPKPSRGFYARTRIAQYMPQSLDWTNQSMYELIRDRMLRARMQSGEKRGN